MATNANLLAIASTSVNTSAMLNVNELRSASAVDVPAIGNYPAKYMITFTRQDGTVGNFTYTTSGARNTAFTALKTNFGTTF